jgi:hypothetical protein
MQIANDGGTAVSVPAVAPASGDSGDPRVNVVSGVEIDPNVVSIIDPNDVLADVLSESNILCSASASASLRAAGVTAPASAAAAAASSSSLAVSIPATSSLSSPIDRNDVCESPGPGYGGTSNGGGGVVVLPAFISISLLCAIAASPYGTPNRPTVSLELINRTCSSVGPLEGYWNAVLVNVCVSGAEMREETDMVEAEAAAL